MSDIVKLLEAEAATPSLASMPKERVRLWILCQAVQHGKVSLAGLLKLKPPSGFKLSRPSVAIALKDLSPLMDVGYEKQLRGRSRTLWSVKSEYQLKIGQIVRQWQENSGSQDDHISK